MIIPKEGWKDDRVEDMKGEDFTCDYCKKEKIRFVHVLTHPEYEGEYRVGCVCAGKLTGNPELSRQKEKERRNEARKLETWQKRKEKEETEKPRFFDSFKELPVSGKKNWYKGTLDDKLYCIVWLGSLGNWAFGIHKDKYHQFKGDEWIWTDSSGHRAHSLDEAKQMAWEYISINKESLGLASRKVFHEDRHYQKTVDTHSKEEQKDKPVTNGIKMDLPSCMYEIAKAFPDLGVDPQKAYTLGQTHLTVVRPEGLTILKITGYEYYKEIEGAPGYDSPAYRILNLARRLCEN